MKLSFPAAIVDRVVTKNPELPPFVRQRIGAFDERRRSSWAGRHIMHGLAPAANALMLQINDYLDLARHPTIVEAQRRTLAEAGNGMMMSALFMQEVSPLRKLEADFATTLGYGAAVLSQSGYNANVGLVQSIAGERTPVYIDMLAHASLWEGIKSSGAIAVPIFHNDPEHLERQLLRHGPGVVLVDSVYSSNGSVCPLETYANITRQHDCVFVVDESHSLGTHGARGEGRRFRACKAGK